MKKLFNFFLFTLTLTFLLSCSITNKNHQFIIGHWEVDQLGPFISKSRPGGANPGLVKTDSLPDNSNISALLSEANRNSLLEFKNIIKDAKPEIKKLMRLSMFASITFSDNKTARVYFGKKKFPALWKMSHNGKKIVLQDTASTKKLILKVVSMDSLHMMTLNKFPQGSLQKTYRKQQ
jgi:hypothetical protein